MQLYIDELPTPSELLKAQFILHNYTTIENAAVAVANAARNVGGSIHISYDSLTVAAKTNPNLHPLFRDNEKTFNLHRVSFKDFVAYYPTPTYIRLADLPVSSMDRAVFKHLSPKLREELYITLTQEDAARARNRATVFIYYMGVLTMVHPSNDRCFLTEADITARCSPLLLGRNSYSTYTIAQNQAIFFQLLLSKTRDAVASFHSNNSVPAIMLSEDSNGTVPLYRASHVSTVSDWEINEFGKIDIVDGVPMINIVSNVKQISFKQYLKDQIRVRYGFCDRPKAGLCNEVIDSFYPRIVYNYGLDATAIPSSLIPKSSVAISGLVAQNLNVKQLDISDLLKVLGYTKHQIAGLLTEVKKKKFTMVFAGAGGTGMNTAYWLHKLCEYTDTLAPFYKIYVYEAEDIEISNMLRFPLGYEHYERPLDATLPNTKLRVISQFIDKLSSTAPVYLGRYIDIATICQYDPWAVKDETGHFVKVPTTFIYGAPSLTCRNDMALISNFVSATHADSSCSIWLNPHQDVNIQTESYGMIQLGTFFMNQLRMAIGLLELLASGQDLSVPDTNILNYTFDGLTQLPTRRNYHWQIVQNITMATEEQASF